ncbi:MAG: outer membrane lipoprotein chaperone LolA [Bdellovibrionales bacterium]|nr:outer membrane lipoprotein chaperone LolA [Bdellovibrionales bacterium]
MIRVPKILRIPGWISIAATAGLLSSCATTSAKSVEKVQATPEARPEAKAEVESETKAVDKSAAKPSKLPKKVGANQPAPAKNVAKTKEGAGTFLPPLLQEVEAKYTAAQTIEAKFTQTTFQKALGKSKESNGTLKIKRPNKVRWETEAPDKNLLVSDGQTFWFYTPPFEEGDSGQLMTKKTAEVQSRMANALLSGSFSMAKDMKIEPIEGSRFVLIPKKGTAGTVIRAEIAIDPKTKIIQSVFLTHAGGNEARIRLSQIQLGKAEADATFQFKAPPGTEVLKQ